MQALPSLWPEGESTGNTEREMDRIGTSIREEKPAHQHLSLSAITFIYPPSSRSSSPTSPAYQLTTSTAGCLLLMPELPR